MSSNAHIITETTKGYAKRLSAFRNGCSYSFLTTKKRESTLIDFNIKKFWVLELIKRNYLFFLKQKTKS